MRVTLVLLLFVLPAMSQDDADLAEMAKNVGDYRVKFRLIQAGLPALKHLMPQAASDDKRLAFYRQNPAAAKSLIRVGDSKAAASISPIASAFRKSVVTRIKPR